MLTLEQYKQKLADLSAEVEKRQQEVATLIINSQSGASAEQLNTLNTIEKNLKELAKSVAKAVSDAATQPYTSIVDRNRVTNNLAAQINALNTNAVNPSMKINIFTPSELSNPISRENIPDKDKDTNRFESITAFLAIERVINRLVEYDEKKSKNQKMNKRQIAKSDKVKEWIKILAELNDLLTLQYNGKPLPDDINEKLNAVIQTGADDKKTINVGKIRSVLIPAAIRNIPSPTLAGMSPKNTEESLLEGYERSYDFFENDLTIIKKKSDADLQYKAAELQNKEDQKLISDTKNEINDTDPTNLSSAQKERNILRMELIALIEVFDQYSAIKLDLVNKRKSGAMDEKYGETGNDSKLGYVLGVRAELLKQLGNLNKLDPSRADDYKKKVGFDLTKKTIYDMIHTNLKKTNTAHLLTMVDSVEDKFNNTVRNKSTGDTLSERNKKNTNSIMALLGKMVESSKYDLNAAVEEDIATAQKFKPK